MSCSYILFLASKFPEPNPYFLIQLFACIGAVLGLVWVIICVWQKIFPPKNPPHHELATRAELNQLRTDVNSALEEMKNRSAERAVRNDEKLTQILVELASIKTGMVAQHQFSRSTFDNLDDKISNVSKSVHKRIDHLKVHES